MKKRTQTFNDGVVKIYNVKDISSEGDRPKYSLELKETLRFDEKKVGMTRFWVAMQSSTKIDKILRVPLKKDVSTQDRAIPNDGEQYEIKQIQNPEDVVPKVMDMSLEKAGENYDII